MYQALKHAFYSHNENEPPGFMHRDVTKIHNALPLKLQEKVSKKKLRDFLQSQTLFTQQKKAVGNFKRNHYNVFNTNELWQIDLITLSPTFYRKSDKTFHYLLTVIDCFDRFGFVQCLKSKRAFEVVKAFDKIIKKSDRIPKFLSSDRGKEFVNKDFKAYLKNNNIEQRLIYTTLKSKASMVEIFNKTFQQKMMRWFSLNGEKIKNGKSFENAIDTVTNIYNNTVHSSTKFKPVDVKSENITKVYSNIHKKFKKEIEKTPFSTRKFFPGDFVRVINKKHSEGFQKKTLTSAWSKEIFRIDKVIDQLPYRMYTIKDLRETKIVGKLYEKELQTVNLPAETPIRILNSDSELFETMRNRKNNANDRIHVELLNGKKNIQIVRLEGKK